MSKKYVISEEVVDKVEIALENFKGLLDSIENNTKSIDSIIADLKNGKKTAKEITVKEFEDILTDWCVDSCVIVGDCNIKDLLEKLNEKKREAECIIL